MLKVEPRGVEVQGNVMEGRETSEREDNKTTKMSKDVRLHRPLSMLTPNSHVEILIEPIEIRLQLLLRPILPLRRVSRVLVHVREEDGLGKGRFDVFTGTTVSVSAGSDLAFMQTSTGVR